MKGDFTRNTFDPKKDFTRVLMQQGRVLLDSDWNEQAEIQQHYLRKLAVDLIGPHAGPIGPNGETDGYPGFSITPENGDLTIGDKRYYVDGIRCENTQITTYYGQHELFKEKRLIPEPPYLVYIDVWERHVTFLEDDNLREVALGGPDTTTRSKVDWLVRVWPSQKHTEDDRKEMKNKHLNLDLDPNHPNSLAKQLDKQWDEWKSLLGKEPYGSLKARAKVNASPKKIEPCAISPEARYSGLENRLYRVEIHKGGESSVATFKWSRENGSVVYPIKNIGAKNNLIRVALEHLGHGDDRKMLNKGDWVEVESDEIILRKEVLQTETDPLLKVMEINKNDKVVYLYGEFSIEAESANKSNLLLRRWDHRVGDPKKNGLELVEGAASIKEDKWLNLEDGIQVWFSSPNVNTENNFYRTGDYWLIPARTATGNVQWPQFANDPAAIPPHGVEHHYAPLMIIDENKKEDCRRKIIKLWQ